MHSTLFIALLAGLGSMVGWGTADFFAKKTIDKIGDIRTLFWQQLIGIVPLLAIFAFSPHVPKLNHFDPLFLVLLGAVSGLSYIPLYKGFGKGQLSLLSPIFAAYSVTVVIISILFLHEPLSIARGIAIATVVLGILLISTNLHDLETSFHKRAFRLAGLPEVVSAMLIYSVWLVLLDKFLNGKQWVFYILVIRVLSMLTLLMYTFIRRIPLRVFDRTLWKFLLGIGLFDVAAFSFVSYGFSHTQYPSIIAVLSATFSIPTIILARIFLKEQITKLQLVAMAVIICGIVLISLS